MKNFVFYFSKKIFTLHPPRNIKNPHLSKLPVAILKSTRQGSIRKLGALGHRKRYLFTTNTCFEELNPSSLVQLDYADYEQLGFGSWHI